jgi:hypothetical protein
MKPIMEWMYESRVLDMDTLRNSGGKKFCLNVIENKAFQSF